VPHQQSKSKWMDCNTFLANKWIASLTFYASIQQSKESIMMGKKDELQNQHHLIIKWDKVSELQVQHFVPHLIIKRWQLRRKIYGLQVRHFVSQPDNQMRVGL